LKIQDKLIFICLSQVLLCLLFVSLPLLGSEVKEICRDSSCEKFNYLKNKNTVEWAVYKDKIGLHFLGIDQIETGKIGYASFKSRLTGYSYLIESDSLHKEEWRIIDFSPNIITRISYLQNTLSIVDLDSDGFAETSFLYCISGDCCDPWTVKLMMHKNNQKLAIRGKVPISEEDIDSYEINIDLSFNGYSKDIQQFALKEWQKAIRLHWKDILGSSVESLFK